MNAMMVKNLAGGDSTFKSVALWAVCQIKFSIWLMD